MRPVRLRRRQLVSALCHVLLEGTALLGFNLAHVIMLPRTRFDLHVYASNEHAHALFPQHGPRRLDLDERHRPTFDCDSCRRMRVVR